MIRSLLMSRKGAALVPPAIKGFTFSNPGVEETTLTLTKPTGGAAPVTGDLLILLTALEYTGTGTPFNDLAGWTRPTRNGNTASDVWSGYYWRIADGTEAATEVVTLGIGDDYTAGFYLVVENASGIDVDGVAATSSPSGSFITTAITTTVAEALAVSFIGFDGADAAPFSTAGTGWLNASIPTDQEKESGDGSAGGAGVSCGFVTKAMPIAGTTEDCTWSASASDGWSGFQFAIAP